MSSACASCPLLLFNGVWWILAVWRRSWFSRLLKGDLLLRAHKPFAYAYLSKDGAWDKLIDTLPQGTLRRVKMQMMVLEGLFRSSDLVVNRGEGGLLEFLKTKLNGVAPNNVDAPFKQWMTSALTGPSKKAKANKAKGSKGRQGK